ncbi:MAG: glycoside hydrolase family 99-like domain-containing protein [Sulfolobales archaeon]
MMLRWGRRDYLKFLAGLGLGAVVAEVYERLYSIPLLERAFRAEISYWINEYNSAREELESLKRRLAMLEDDVHRLSSTVEYLDGLERESLSAISIYRQRMLDAIEGLRRAVERYRLLLGDDRVAFERSVLGVLEDLRDAEDSLYRLARYFPLISDLRWIPAKIVNDKIYDVEVIFEVISPLNSLSEAVVSLIPVEYRYMVERYGMGEEDYHRVFPREEVRRARLSPKGLEREVFSTVFKNLAGGREYRIVVSVKDTAGNTRVAEVRTPYIRGYENLSREALELGIRVGAYYYPWYGANPVRHWDQGYRGRPLLGRYDSRDEVVVNKHIDWATGHGIGFFIISWWGVDSYEDHVIADIFMRSQLAGDIKFAILYESLGRLRWSGDNDIAIDLDDPVNREILKQDLRYLGDRYFKNENYLRIKGRPAIFIYLSRIFRGNISEVISDIREELGNNIYIVGDIAYWQNPYDEKTIEQCKPYDAITSYNMHINNKEILDSFENNLEKKYSEWLAISKKLGKGFIPSAIPGFDDREVRRGNLPLPKSPERFKQQLEIAYRYMDSNLRIITITSFNEWHEYTYIEPSAEDNFEYLEITRDFLHSINLK